MWNPAAGTSGVGLVFFPAEKLAADELFPHHCDADRTNGAFENLAIRILKGGKLEGGRSKRVLFGGGDIFLLQHFYPTFPNPTGKPTTAYKSKSNKTEEQQQSTPIK